MKLFRIFRAWYYWIVNRNDEVARYRTSICAKCDYLKRGACSICWCPIISKSRLLDEECPHPDGDKWKVENKKDRTFPGVRS